ncbi:rust resistance kinase Lr10-like isoform X1 [Iris pallida]|uniref:Rust resistance kinase Lr10-like isoform X1 n=1 Tax=Iris pallida TaxID=29817 RepID=A0AAX6HRT3_IRIPA|nr:rust resistance kinase Lr10-like isoform X1 [Iris pallida]
MKGQGTACIASSSPALISFLLLFVSVISLTAGQQVQDCSSSCGEIENIRYPFRLKSDPAHCGDRKYELICSGNRTILELFSGQVFPGQYYVTNISYGQSLVNDYRMNYDTWIRVRVVNVNFASGKCALPSRFVSPTYTMISNYYYYMSWPYCLFAFLNCSEKIQDGRNYQLVPCLNSNTNNNGYIYVTRGPGCYEIEADSLAPSCSFLYEVPGGEYLSEDQYTDIFKLLQMGFTLVSNFNERNIYEDPRVADIILRCIKDAIQEANHDIRHTSTERGLRITIRYIAFPFSVQQRIVQCLRRHGGISSQIIASVIAFINIAIFVIVFATLGRFVFGPLSIFVFLCHHFCKTRVPMDKIEKFLRFQQNLEPARYSYPDIVSMTCNFKVKLGQGGFGSVFRGDLPGGYPVAVKMLGNTKFNGDDFISEVSTIGRIHHLNVVRLVGFCSEGSKRALVYEYMPNGSLDKYIFSAIGADRYFTMDKLNEIALGVARGIDYLHRGCDMRILHFDIKPQNILLDQNFNPKVSDFGLARLYPKDYSIVTVSAARGTIGYIAPELVSRCFGVVSNKSDVYSFGMLLMEMAGARRNFDRRVENSSECYYPSWIYDRLQQTEESEEVEICRAAIEIDDMERKLCKVGLWCIQTKASDRPSMSKVVELLEADTDTLALPPKPFLSSSHTISIRQSDMESSDLTELSIISEE